MTHIDVSVLLAQALRTGEHSQPEENHEHRQAQTKRELARTDTQQQHACDGLGQPVTPVPSLSVEVHSLRHLAGDIVDYLVFPSARIVGRPLREIALPDGVAVTLVVRGEQVIVPRGGTVLYAGDHAFLALRNHLKPLVDRLFGSGEETVDLPPGLTLDFEARKTVGQLHWFLGCADATDSEVPAAALLQNSEAGVPARVGDFLVGPHDNPEFVRLTYVADSARAPRT